MASAREKRLCQRNENKDQMFSEDLRPRKKRAAPTVNEEQLEKFVEEVCKYAKQLGIDDIRICRIVNFVAKKFRPTLGEEGIVQKIFDQEKNVPLGNYYYHICVYQGSVLPEMTVGELADFFAVHQGTFTEEFIKANGGDVEKLIMKGDKYIHPNFTIAPLFLFPYSMDKKEYYDFAREMKNIWKRVKT